MMHNINVVMIAPDPLDATSFYRAVGPFSALRREVPGMTLSINVNCNWAVLAMADIIFLQRAYSNAHLEIVQLAKDMGKAVWLDYDDDLFNVPVDNPAHQLYAQPSVRANIATMIEASDFVSVSTDHLKRAIEKGGLLRRGRRPCDVIPNALDESLLHYRQAMIPVQRRQILWRGSTSHRPDLLEFKDAILHIVRRHKQWSINFFGDLPPFLKEKALDNVVYTPPASPLHYYFRSICEMRSPALIVPLVDSDFNKAKSNIAWLEAVFAGGIAIAPDWPEWRRPGCINYSNQDSFMEAVEAVIAGKVDVQSENRAGWDYIQRNAMLRDINRLRVDIIESVRGD
jgi:hypothetical protein